MTHIAYTLMDTIHDDQRRIGQLKDAITMALHILAQEDLSSLEDSPAERVYCVLSAVMNVEI